MGLIRDFPAYENAILGYQVDPEYCRHGFLEKRRIIGTCLRWMRGYDVRPDDAELKAASFSGGNQQKLVLARELEHDPDLLLVGQPTRGVDIGAIEFIHERLRSMRNAGGAVLLVSSELDEVLSLSDRVAVIYRGKLVAVLDAKDADRDRVGLLMAGAA